MKDFLKQCVVIAASSGLLALGSLSAANAAIVSTGELVDIAERQDRIAHIDALLAREGVREQLTALGVDADEARLRVAALSDRELAELGERLEEMPAGGDALGLVGAVFVVLIILEFVGVIDIFKRN